MDSSQPPGRETIALTYDGMDRPYLLQVPPATAVAAAAGVAAARDRVPLVLQLHGRGIDAVRFDRLTGFGALAGEQGFALAMPSAVGEIWNDGRDAAPEGMRPDDVGYLAVVIDDATTRLAIDSRRIYIVGMSNGAAMAARLVCEHADRIAAFAQVAGTVGASVAATCRPARPVPILSVHGTADNAAPYEGGVRRGLLTRAMLRHAAGPSVGVDEWARFWVEANGALDGPVVSELPPDITIRTWRGPSPSSDVVFYRIEGTGHTWPGSRFALPALLFGRTSRTFDAARVIWEFLAAHAG
jgi:polyhydroxybutyrate depolymerase